MGLLSVLNRLTGNGAEIKKANDKQLAKRQGGEVRNRPHITTGMGGTGGFGYGGSWLADILGYGTLGTAKDDAGNVEDNSIYSICTSFIAFESVKAALELQQYEKENDTWNNDPEHIAAQLLQNPHPYMALSGIIGALSVDLARGNAFCQVPKTAAGRPAELWWLPRENWRVWLENVDGQHYKRYQVTIPGGALEHYWDITAPDISGDGTNSVIHFRSPKPDPTNFLLGFDPVPAQFRHLCVDNEGGQYQHTVLKNLGISPVIFVNKDKETVPDGPAKQEFKRQWRSNTTGENRGDVTIMDSEYEIKELTNNPEKMALDTILNRPEERIPAALRLNAMALQLGGATQRSTFNNVEEAKKSAWDNGIAPLHTIIADTLNHKLLPAFDTVPSGTRIAGGDGTKRRFWFNYADVPDLQEDENAMHERANKDFTGGGVTVNEKRAMLRLKPLENDPRGDLMAHELKAPGAAPDAQGGGQPDAQGKEVKAFDPRQPRDDHGKWTDSAGRLSVGHAIAVMKHEGISDTKHHEAVKQAIENGTHQTREDVLKHIDAIHAAGKEPAETAPKTKLRQELEEKVREAMKPPSHEEPASRKYRMELIRNDPAAQGGKAIRPLLTESDARAKVTEHLNRTFNSYTGKNSAVTDTTAAYIAEQIGSEARHRADVHEAFGKKTSGNIAPGKIAAIVHDMTQSHNDMVSRREKQDVIDRRSLSGEQAYVKPTKEPKWKKRDLDWRPTNNGFATDTGILIKGDAPAGASTDVIHSQPADANKVIAFYGPKPSTQISPSVHGLGFNDFPTVRMSDGTLVQKQYIDLITARFPDATFHKPDEIEYSPLVVRDKGEIVGVVMPMAPELAKAKAKKSVDEFGQSEIDFYPAESVKITAMKTDETDAPEPLPDPHGVGFSDADLAALTETDSPEAIKLAYGVSTAAKRELLGADVINEDA